MVEKMGPMLPGLLISLASLWMAWEARRHSRSREAHAEIEGLKGRIVAMETKIEIFWKGVSYSSAGALHSPHTPELDALIEQFQDGSIDDGGLARFKVMLEDLTEDEGETKFRRKLARDVLTLIHIRYEVAEPAGRADGGGIEG